MIIIGVQDSGCIYLFSWVLEGVFGIVGGSFLSLLTQVSILQFNIIAFTDWAYWLFIFYVAFWSYCAQTTFFEM